MMVHHKGNYVSKVLFRIFIKNYKIQANNNSCTHLSIYQQAKNRDIQEKLDINNKFDYIMTISTVKQTL